MGSKHTPKWVAERAEAGGMYIVEEHAGRVVASVASCDDEVAIGNLFAAAPELLEELERLVAGLDRWNEEVVKLIGRPVGWTDELDSARAAIAKAKRETA